MTKRQIKRTRKLIKQWKKEDHEGVKEDLNTVLINKPEKWLKFTLHSSLPALLPYHDRDPQDQDDPPVSFCVEGGIRHLCGGYKTEAY